MTNPNNDLTIIGLGPRGHFALKQITHELARNGVAKTASILLFEETSQPEIGPVWDTAQSESNWSNIEERVGLAPFRPRLVPITSSPKWIGFAAKSG